ncbi:GNAT family N-acetyltransferase [Marivivens donghaensis]|uniref:GNAT family N-acetyltransferase n=1 Tax=Marivivens donghaensis TaxID=1699413 RepID=UPI0015896B48|nr:GNAT family N-acetyltransferase [Marivivens donghaensis]
MIRPAVSSDVAAITAIASASFAHYVSRIGQPPAPMIADYAALVNACSAYVFEDEAILGYLVLEPLQDAMLLDIVAVFPDAQGRGVGKALMVSAEKQTRAAGLSTIRLYTNALMHENVGLYAKIGYAETGRKTENGFDRIYMEKRL